jgi:hypothetical protein
LAHSSHTDGQSEEGHALVLLGSAVYDVTGRHVALVGAGRQDAGRHTLQWDGRDDRGVEVPTGVYFLRFEAGDRMESRKLVRLR